MELTETTEYLPEIPNSWIYIALKHIASNKKNAIKRGPFGSAIKKEYFVSSGYKIYEQKNAIYNNCELGNYYIDENKFLQLKDFEVQSGDIIISCSGTVGKIAVIPLNSPPGIINQALLKISLDNQKILTEYFIYLFISESFQKVFLKNTRGSAMKNIASVKVLKSVSIPIPPFNEQKRIVAKIEALQTRSQRVKEELEEIESLLDRFRQSVLAAAFRGDLTKNWREQNPDVEPAEVLLERIRVDRRRRWEEAELEKMKAKGKIPKDDKWKKKYKEPEEIDSEGLSELPNGWTWINYELLIKESQNGLSKRKGTQGQSIPVLRLADIQNNKIAPEEAREILLTDNEIERYLLYPNDLLCIRVNGSADLVGRIIIFNEDEKWAFCDHFIRYKLVDKLVSIPYIANFFNTQLVRQYINQYRVSSAGQNTVSQTTLGNIPIPIPSLEEQKEIVRSVESLFKLADNIEQQHKQAEIDLETLNQSILAKAFRGELVPQDPNDEPASVLLERIREEKAAAKKSKKKKKTQQLKMNYRNL